MVIVEGVLPKRKIEKKRLIVEVIIHWIPNETAGLALAATEDGRTPAFGQRARTGAYLSDEKRALETFRNLDLPLDDFEDRALKKKLLP